MTPKMKKNSLEQYIGSKFFRLTVVQIVDNRKVKCICDCGNEKITRLSLIKSGNTKSCGCAGRDYQENRGTHHKTHSRIYRIWFNMRQRCNAPTRNAYARYGGRGIKVCERWDKSFEAFYEDTKEGYNDSLTLDRINNNKGYEPGNVRWVTKLQQMQNTSRSIFLEFQGEKMTIADWARRLNVKLQTLRSRYKKNWLTKDILTIPVKKGWVYKAAINQDSLDLPTK